MDLIINSKIIKPDHNRGYNVRYYLYKEDGDAVDIDYDIKSAYKNSNTACFAGLLSELRSLTDVNRLMYIRQKNAKTNKNVTNVDPDNLDTDEVKYWITICKAAEALPPYLQGEWAEKDRFVLKLANEENSPSLLYIYLACFRAMQEDPGFTRAMLFLVAGYQMNFCAAWCLASMLAMSNSGHNIVPLGRGYGSKVEDNVNNIEVEIGWAIALNRYLKEPSKYDTRKLRDVSQYYEIHKTLKNVCSITNRVSGIDLLSDNCIKVLNTENDKEAREYLKNVA